MSVFGGMPFPVQFFLAFIVVLGLIGVAAWLVRRLGAGRLGGVGLRGRQPRLAVVDYASVDGRRRLILVRRDNIEHLVMIGGPSDIVVESNIVRAAPATREVTVARPPAMAEPLPRTIPAPAPEPAAAGAWPLQPEPAIPPAAPRLPRNEPLPEEPAAWPLQPQADTQSRPPRDTLAALADELSTRPPAPQRPRPQANMRPQPPELRPETRVESRAEPRQEPHQEIREETRQETRQEARPEPRPESRQEPIVQQRPAAAPPVISEAAAAADRSLAEMAQQLEAALRKPAPKAERSEPRMPAPPRSTAPSEGAPPPAPAVASPTPNGSAARNVRSPEVKPPARPDAKQAPASKTLYDSLEQEMASLLGRPTAKN